MVYVIVYTFIIVKKKTTLQDRLHGCSDPSLICRPLSLVQIFAYFSFPSSTAFYDTFEAEASLTGLCSNWTQEATIQDKESFEFFIIEELTGEVVSWIFYIAM